VLRAQRDLGVEVPDGAMEAHERVDRVDLGSIAARERVTRHARRRLRGCRTRSTRFVLTALLRYWSVVTAQPPLMPR